MRYPELQRLGVEVIGASVDNVYTHKIWEQTELSKMTGGTLPFPLAADRGGHLGSLYGVYDQQQGVNQRSHFLVDPSGKVQLACLFPSAVGRGVEELVRLIKACQEQQATGGQMPANWQPGVATLPGDMASTGYVWKIWKAR